MRGPPKNMGEKPGTMRKGPGSLAVLGARLKSTDPAKRLRLGDVPRFTAIRQILSRIFPRSTPYCRVVIVMFDAVAVPQRLGDGARLESRPVGTAALSDRDGEPRTLGSPGSSRAKIISVAFSQRAVWGQRGGRRHGHRLSGLPFCSPSRYISASILVTLH